MSRCRLVAAGDCMREEVIPGGLVWYVVNRHLDHCLRRHAKVRCLNALRTSIIQCSI